jgi:prevent-host-death family protein
MKTASISEAKDQFSKLITRARSGESTVILDRGVPVATIEPIRHHDADTEGRLQRLERAGLIKRGTGKIPIDLIRTAPPATKSGASVVEALLEERRSGR